VIKIPPWNRATFKFTTMQLAALRPTGKPHDIADPAVAGLLVRVGPSGTKRWLFRYQWNGERTVHSGDIGNSASTGHRNT